MKDSSAIYTVNGTISEEILIQKGQYILGKENQSLRRMFSKELG